MRFILLITFSFLSISLYQPPKHTWKGKEVSYQQLRDSLRITYLNYCDSLRRSK